MLRINVRKRFRLNLGQKRGIITIEPGEHFVVRDAPQLQVYNEGQAVDHEIANHEYTRGYLGEKEKKQLRAVVQKRPHTLNVTTPKKPTQKVVVPTPNPQPLSLKRGK